MTNAGAESWHEESGYVIDVKAKNLPLRVFIFCLAAELLLVFLDATVNFSQWTEHSTIQRLFNIAREDGLATWFMVIQTFVAASVLWVIFFLQRDRGVTRRHLAGWGFLAGFFTYLSADDGAMIHERLGSLTKSIIEADKDSNSSGFLVKLQDIVQSYEWHLIALPLLVAAGLFMLIFLWREFNARGERLIMFAAAAFMALAVGLDFFEGMYYKHPFNVLTWFSNVFEFKLSSVWHFQRSLEEFLEMLAMSSLLALFLHHLIRISGPGLTFRFVDVKH